MPWKCVFKWDNFDSWIASYSRVNAITGIETIVLVVRIKRLNMGVKEVPPPRIFFVPPESEEKRLSEVPWNIHNIKAALEYFHHIQSNDCCCKKERNLRHIYNIMLILMPMLILWYLRRRDSADATCLYLSQELTDVGHRSYVQYTLKRY